MAIAPNTYCIPCALAEPRRESIATLVINGDPMCPSCGRAEKGIVPLAPPSNIRSYFPTCSRGCGRDPHKGACAGKPKAPTPQVEPTPKPAEPEAPPQPTRTTRMDKLAAEVVKLKDVPPATVKHYGRIGELFTLLLELPVGEGHAIKVKCRDAYHAGSTNRDIRKKARKAAIAIQGRRVGSDYYCWRKA